MLRIASALFLALLVTACGGREGRDVVRQDNKAFQSQTARQCLTSLKSADVKYSPHPNIEYGYCGISLNKQIDKHQHNPV